MLVRVQPEKQKHAGVCVCVIYNIYKNLTSELQESVK